MRLIFTASGLAAAAFVASASTIAGAWIFEWMGYAPCPLCYAQRQPHYYGMAVLAFALLSPVALLFLPSPTRRRIRAFAGWMLPAAVLLAAASVYAYGAFIAAHHAGAELGFWSLPGGCGSTLPQGGLTPEQLLGAIRGKEFVDCLKPELFVLGLSLAAWNAVISAAIAALAGTGAFLQFRARSGKIV